MNSVDPYIQFTYEVEHKNRLPFLDVLVVNSGEEFITTVYRKPFAVCLPPHSLSSHPSNQKLAAFKTYIYRALNICSTSEFLTSELNYLEAIDLDRGYSPGVIDSIYKKFTKLRILEKPSKSLKNLVVLPFYPKVSFQIAKVLKSLNFSIVFSPVNKVEFTDLNDPIDSFNSWGIYKISYQCCLSYVGQTKRALRNRLEEHAYYVKNQDYRSAIFKHSWTFDHNFKLSSAEVIQNVFRISI